MRESKRGKKKSKQVDIFIASNLFIYFGKQEGRKQSLIDVTIGISAAESRVSNSCDRGESYLGFSS